MMVTTEREIEHQTTMDLESRKLIFFLAEAAGEASEQASETKPASCPFECRPNDQWRVKLLAR